MGDAGVGIGAEEVAIVGQEVRPDYKDIVAEPDSDGEDGGRDTPRARHRASAVYVGWRNSVDGVSVTRAIAAHPADRGR